ncbi:MAG: 23S rRNA (guanine(2445)-N(2))/(guanine(2069)-N(7))-methyltransferase, partial [Gammaproteobacteria bacterium]|nr:23S rRNA (guanine(2445)-N(2))/(guanine(2069)-N(7))-methyltransferase [Gammaproteobacteria bacterium]
IIHTHFGAQKVKDAVVDQIRARTGRRPSVQKTRPDLRINVYLYHDQATVSLDLSGESLHRRAYRSERGKAPLKENLAAAILARAGWPEIARGGGALIDPMCGAGTLPIEAGLIAADIAPGLLRQYWGFAGWKRYDAQLWSGLISEARQRRLAGLRRVAPIRGYDNDRGAVDTARRNVRQAGLDGKVVIERRDIADCVVEDDVLAGIVVVNPPYGERMSDRSDVPEQYRQLGSALKRCYAGWRAAVFTGNPEAAHHLGLQAHRTHTLYNGAIACKLLHYRIHPKRD